MKFPSKVLHNLGAPCFQKGDLLLRVNEASLDGLTHSQAVATLKATISLSSVTLVIMEVSIIIVEIIYVSEQG